MGFPVSQVLIPKKAGTWLKNIRAEHGECAIAEVCVHSYGTYSVERLR